MSVELLYTSAPKGLRQGSRGFCTVLSTVGTPVNLATRLESLSGYRHLFGTDGADADSNPVAYSHVKFSLAGQPTSVVSRVAAYGADYSGRTNKLAHHVVVNLSEAPPAGPAWLIQQPGFMRTAWDGRCVTPAIGPVIPQADQAGKVCESWQRQMGDAGWGGVVADALAKPNRAGKPTWIVYTIDQRDSLLGLLNESIALLPQNERWNATFSTYAVSLPPDVECRVRCVVEGTEESRFAAARGQVIQLVPKSYAGTASERINQARGISPSVHKHAPSVTVIPTAELADQVETPPATPPLPGRADAAAAGMPDLPARHPGQWTALVLLTVVLMTVLIGALTFFVLQSRSNTAAVPENAGGAELTMNPADTVEHVAAVNPETTDAVESISNDPDAEPGEPQEGSVENVPETVGPDSTEPEPQTLNLSQMPPSDPVSKTVELLQAPDEKKNTKREPAQDDLDPQLNISGDQSQLELTLESMLRGRPEVLISAGDQRILDINDKDSAWVPRDGQTASQNASISVVARQSVHWIDACKQPPAADVRIHRIDADKHANWEINAAISKSDQRLFLRVRAVPGSSGRLAESANSIKSLIDDLDREISKISSKDQRKDLLQIRRVWNARKDGIGSGKRIRGVGEQLRKCRSLISDFQQTAVGLSNERQQQLDAYQQVLNSIEQPHRALSEEIQACVKETFIVDTGRELHLFAAAVGDQVDPSPVLVFSVKFSVNVTEPGR